MSFDIYFWIDAAIAFFIGFLMLIDYRRYKQQIFLLMFYVYLVIFIKSVLYIWPINLTSIKWVEAVNQNNLSIRTLDQAFIPLYNFRYFIFQFLESLFVFTVTYAFIFNRKSIEDENLKSTKIVMVVQYLLLIGISVTVISLSLIFGNIDTYQTDIPIVEFFKSKGGRFIFVFWKLVMLIFAWRAISSVFGYIMNLLRTIARYKRRILFFIILEITFDLFSGLFDFYAFPGWFFFHNISLIFLTVFAFANHAGFIDAIQDKVESLSREKNMIVSSMREISTIVGAGDFELETVIKKIVEDSVKGTNARGGAALLKDPVTNRLNVMYVEGLYPPTKPFKTTQGLTLTEAVIVGKFKSEKIAIGEGLLGKVAQDGQSIFIPDAQKDETFPQTLMEHMTVTSFMAVPLKTKDEVFGVLTVVDDARSFLESDLSLLETMGEQAAITINQIQMYQQVLEKKQAEKEIGVAAEIQSSLIPHTFPEADKFDLYGFSIPAKGIGGDYYDYINFGNNKIALAMFDVSGKGVPASLIMVMIRSILRTIASLNEDTKDVLIKLNNTVASEIVEDRYATGFYLLFDAEKGIMSYTNAGHGPLVLYRSAADDFEFLDTEGMPIGIMSGVDYGQNYTILEKSDVAILYTDGITEAMNLSHEEFGMDRFKEVIRKYRKESSREIANRVLESITNFAGNAPQHDDETLLVLKSK